MWQLKLFGSALITLCLTSAGFLKAQKLADRCISLELAQKFIVKTGDKIRSGENEIQEIINGVYPKEIKKESLTNEEKSVLEEFIKGAGMGDFITEEKRCNLYLEKITELKEKAVKEKNEKSKLYCTVGLASGLMVSLLLV